MISINNILKCATVASGVFSFLILLLTNWLHNKKNNLEDLFVVGIGGSSIPTGIILIYCAFDKEIIGKLTDINIMSLSQIR